MKKVICQMCSGKTSNPIKVKFYGWNREIDFPVQINLCPRCHSIWKEDNNV